MPTWRMRPFALSSAPAVRYLDTSAAAGHGNSADCLLRRSPSCRGTGAKTEVKGVEAVAGTSTADSSLAVETVLYLWSRPPQVGQRSDWDASGFGGANWARSSVSSSQDMTVSPDFALLTASSQSPCNGSVCRGSRLRLPLMRAERADLLRQPAVCRYPPYSARFSSFTAMPRQGRSICRTRPRTATASSRWADVKSGLSSANSPHFGKCFPLVVGPSVALDNPIVCPAALLTPATAVPISTWTRFGFQLCDR